MKKNRIIVTVVAVVMAAGAAFATELLDLAPNAYTYNSTIMSCELDANCQNVSGSDCVSGSDPAFNGVNPSGTSCGTRLAKITP